MAELERHEMKQTILAAATLAVASAAADARDPAVRSEFMQSSPCPSTGKSSGGCPGYQVDHRRPLAAGGADATWNMQWLSERQHAAKTARERATCVYGCGTKSYRSKGR